MNSVIEVGCSSLKHYGEELCGDCYDIIQTKDSKIIVLADGLGSGVKANILATLTTKILLTMCANNIEMDEVIATLLNTLPICKVRKISYSTFSIVQIKENGDGILYEYDNPQAIFCKDEKCQDLEYDEIEIQGKKVRKSSFHLNDNDYILLMSDGIVNVGSDIYLNYDWSRKEIKEFMDISNEHLDSATEIAHSLANTCNDLYLNKPYDDGTVVVIKKRPIVTTNILVGPPLTKEDDFQFVREFMNNANYHIVSGGTSAKIVSSYLNKEIKPITYNDDLDVPPMSSLEGIDLVTEGLLTIKKTLQLIDEYQDIYNLNKKTYLKKNGASKLANILLNKTTKINMYVGKGMNFNNYISENEESKLDIVNKLKAKLIKLGKVVTIIYR